MRFTVVRQAASLIPKLRGFFAGAAFSYTSLLILQLHRMRTIWFYREVSGGDTISYFIDAYNWAHRHKGNFAWSPLYTWFFSLFLSISSDAVFVVQLHRVVIAVIAAMAVLAVMRRMLPAVIAWFIGVWWVVMRINFDTSFEVHLFALLPVLGAWLVLMSSQKSSWARGTAVAIFAMSGFLVRNEMLAVAVLLFLICVGWEKRVTGRGDVQPRYRTPIAYALPLLFASSLIFWFYLHSYSTGRELLAEFKGKHVANMGQVYAYGYQQRNPDWEKSPWVDFDELCLRDFGIPEPSLLQMLRRNPRAYLHHVEWNYTLLPAGIQLMLFDATSGTRDPDYGSPRLHKKYVAWLSFTALGVLLIGTVLFWKERRFWWRAWVRPRLLGWLGMLAVALVDILLIVPTQRPRPAYLFSLTVLMMCMLGTCILIIFSRFRPLRRAAPFAAAIAFPLLLFMPSAYGNRDHPGARPVYDDYERLHEYEKLLARPTTVFLGECPAEMHSFLGLDLGPPQHWYDYNVFSELKTRQTLESFLGARRINVLELQGTELLKLESSHPGIFREFLVAGGQVGWRLRGLKTADVRNGWFLFEQEVANANSRLPIVDASEYTGQFAGWYPIGDWPELERPRPVALPPRPIVRRNSGTAWRFQVANQDGGKSKLFLSALADRQSMQITIKLDEENLGDYWISTDSFKDVDIPLALTPGVHFIQISSQASNRAMSHDLFFRRIEIIRQAN